jgi:hypothetical protein
MKMRRKRGSPVWAFVRDAGWWRVVEAVTAVRQISRLNRDDIRVLRRQCAMVQAQSRHRGIPMTTIGYARGSTTDQDLDIQVAAGEALNATCLGYAMLTEPSPTQWGKDR